MKVKVSHVLANWPYFYPRDTFTVIKAEEHMSLLETDTGARQWVGNSFLLNVDGSDLDASTLYASPSNQEPVAVTDMAVAALKGLILLKDLFDVSDRTPADAYHILSQQDGTWGNARSALSALSQPQGE